MLTRRMIVATCALAALMGCSEKEERKTAVAEAKPRITFSSPVKFSSDAKVRLKQQEELVDLMVRDRSVSLGALEGEAYRRGVNLTPAQIATKKSQLIDRNAGPVDAGNASDPPGDDAAASVDGNQS